MPMSEDDERKIENLIDVCKKHQGEYIPSDHGPGSWATTYSNDFIVATAEIYLTWRKYNGHWYTMFSLSELFQKAGIRSCRGSKMTRDRLEYLYTTHVKKIVEKKDRKRGQHRSP